jgi:hypothetical protein
VSDQRVPKQVRTLEHIRSMRSVRVNTGPGRHAEWPRLQETEQIARACQGRRLRRAAPSNKLAGRAAPSNKLAGRAAPSYKLAGRPAGWAERRTR